MISSDVSFQSRLNNTGYSLTRARPRVLQVNMGRLCNLTCVHCHVEAGPGKSRDNMKEETAFDILKALDVLDIKILDITGGAPEMNPNFRFLVRKAKEKGCHVIDRCNLVILTEEDYSDLPAFLAQNSVEIVASLPCYIKENVEAQRGKGSFGKSIQAIKRLNELGYGKDDGKGLELNLVYNPVGPHLPPAQKMLEEDYKVFLLKNHGIRFNRLITITNVPVTRYASYLQAKGQLNDYYELLRQNFNPATLDGLMCRETISVSWDGTVYDCDFNQMLGLGIGGKRTHLKELTQEMIKDISVQTGDHCFGCTAGAGSSCGGAIIP